MYLKKKIVIEFFHNMSKNKLLVLQKKIIPTSADFPVWKPLSKCGLSMILDASLELNLECSPFQVVVDFLSNQPMLLALLCCRAHLNLPDSRTRASFWDALTDSFFLISDRNDGG